MAVLQGFSAASLDDKGRFSVPTKLRPGLLDEDANGAALDVGTVTMTKHLRGCLMLFPQLQWQAFSQVVSALPMSDDWTKRFFLSNSHTLEMAATGGSAGRLLIAPEHRAYAGLQKDILVLGVGKYLEIWDKATYEACEAQELAKMRANLPEVLKSLSF